MMNTPFWTWVGNLCLIVVTLAANAFPVIYARKSPWRLNLVGRDLMWASIGFALVLDLAFATAVLGLEGPWRWVIRTGVYAFLAVIFVKRLVVLLRVQTDPARVKARDLAKLLKRQERANTKEDA